MKYIKNNAQAKLYKDIYDIVLSVKGDISFSNLKYLILSILFYRYLSEKITSSLNKEMRDSGDVGFNYENLDDETAKQYKDKYAATNYYFLLPSSLFKNMREIEHLDIELSSVFWELRSVLAKSYRYSSDIDTVSTLSELFKYYLQKLGFELGEKTTKIGKIFDGVAKLPVSLEGKEGESISFAEAFVYIMRICNAKADNSLGTNATMAKLLTGIAKAGNRHISGVYDPACGAGTLFTELTECLPREDVIFCGSDENSAEICLARMNMYIHGVRRDRVRFDYLDSIYHPIYSEYDKYPINTIISHLPTYVGISGSHNYFWGKIGVSQPEYNDYMTFLIHIARLLREETIAVVTCAANLLYGGSAETKVRRYLVENNFIDCIIKIPVSVGCENSTPINIVVMKADKENDNIRFIDVSQNLNLDEDININKIINIYMGKDSDELSTAIVGKDVIAKEGYCLAVDKYIKNSNSNIINREEHTLSKDELLMKMAKDTVELKDEEETLLGKLKLNWRENSIDLETLKRSIEKDAVVCKALGKVGTCRRGVQLSFIDVLDTTTEESYIPFIQAKDFAEDIYLIEQPGQYVSLAEKEHGVIAPEGSVLFTLVGDKKKVAIAPYDCFIDRDVCCIQSINKEINAKYLAYQLQEKFYDEVGFLKNKANKVDLAPLELYFPSLMVQEECVKLLDSFNSDITKLRVLLQNCRKSYRFHLNQLFNIKDNSVRWMCLGDIGKITTCREVEKNEISAENRFGEPYFTASTFAKEEKEYINYHAFHSKYFKEGPYPEEGNILILTKGDIGRLEIYGERRAYYKHVYYEHDSIVWLAHDNSIICNTYLYYFLEHYLSRFSDANISQIENKDLTKARIPVFPIYDQVEIINVFAELAGLCKEEGIIKQINMYEDKFAVIRLRLLVEFWRILFADKKEQLGFKPGRKNVLKMFSLIDDSRKCNTKSEAIRYWRRAAKLGDVDSLKKISDFCFRNNKFDEASEFLLKYVAGKREDKANAMLAKLYIAIGKEYYENTSSYYTSRKIEKYSKAALWYQRGLNICNIQDKDDEIQRAKDRIEWCYIALNKNK